MQPTAPAIAGAACIGGCVWALLPDIDSPSSIASQFLRYLGRILAIIVAVAYAFCLIAHDNTLLYRIADRVNLVNVIGIIAVCVLVSMQPHRHFTHSCVALALATLTATMIYVPLGEAALIGYASHLLLDFVNYRGESLLWPLRETWCLKLCHSDGRVSNTLCVVAVIFCFYYFISHTTILSSVVDAIPFL